ncbi:MAG: hypothetical protein JW836_05660 [Deltaproteobacteria bacterium]|nr:hypothetical protein [Deltaproteobacteria bacterium]
MAPDIAKDHTRTAPEPHLVLHTNSDLAIIFHDLFQEGVLVDAKVGTTVQTFLCEVLGLTPQYVEERIQTIFLNGKAVDDPLSAVIADHAAIALSAAMPGLLGATLRKGSYYAAMRGEISHEGENNLHPHEGKVLLKLFNLIPGEIGSFILGRGVWLKGDSLKKFLEKRLLRLLEGCLRADIDGKSVDLKKLLQQEWPADAAVFLRVCFL